MPLSAAARVVTRAQKKELMMWEALREGLDEEMERDPAVCIMGKDCFLQRLALVRACIGKGKLASFHCHVCCQLFSGEDVGHYGGSYKVSFDLYKKYGDMRVLDTPICGEQLIIKAARTACNSVL